MSDLLVFLTFLTAVILFLIYGNPFLQQKHYCRTNLGICLIYLLHLGEGGGCFLLLCCCFFSFLGSCFILILILESFLIAFVVSET